ncbi:MAG: transcriptional regulator [Bdellovibrionaceae bacterium]|jgi:DNA-binding transcriptional regulator YiaG|nr:transcriptional regulator [Pseudobdellovibrionaceae bacterium]
MAKKRMANDLIKSLGEAVAMERGKLKGKETFKKLSKPAPKWTKTGVKKLRKEVFQMSQPVFASLLNVKPATVRAWEQGQRTPDGAASRLLEVLSKDAKIAEKFAS